MSELTKELIQHSLEKDYNKASNVFGQIMNVKITDILDQEKIKIYFGQYLITKNGKVYSEYDEEKTKNYMKNTELLVKVDLGIGKGSSTIWGCDLTKEYIDINADYRN